MSDRVIKFSPTIGLTPKVGKIFPYSALAFLLGWSVVLGFTWGIITTYASIAAPEWIAIALWASGVLTEMTLRGHTPYRFESQFWKGKKFVRIGLRFEPTMTALMPEKKAPPLKIGGKLHRAIENEFDVVAPIEFRFGQTSVGAFLLSKGGGYQLVFSWQLTPFPSSISKSDGLIIAKRLRSALTAIPIHESLTFYAGAWRDTSARARDLDDPSINRNFLSKLLNKWEKQRVETQTALGRRLVRTLYCTATYTVRSSRGDKAIDGVEAFADVLSGLSSSVTNWIFPNNKRLENVPAFLRSGYESGWRSANRILSKQMGLPPQSLTVEEMWDREYHRYNVGEVPVMPFKIVVTPAGSTIHKNNSKLLISEIFRHGAPQMEHKRHVYLPGRADYVGGVVWEDKPLVSYEENDPDDALAQLFFGSSVINDCPAPGQGLNASEVWDTEVVVQFTGMSQTEVRRNALAIEEEANFGKKLTRNKGDHSTTSDFKLHKASTDRWALLEGAQVTKISWTAFVYRKDPLELDRAVDALTDLPNCKGRVIPERQYFPLIWQQSLPIKMEYLLQGPGILMWWNRRLEDFTEAAATFIPAIADGTKCQKGVEFQAEYGNANCYVDPFPEDGINHTITLGETGSGKSVWECGRIFNAYTKGIRSFVIDATQGQIATFRPPCDALGGAFFDSQTDGFNLLQGTDFRRHEHDSEMLKYATNLIQNQWINTIPDLALMGRKDSSLKADFLEITGSLIAAWMNDRAIRNQYDAAYDAGLGSRIWQEDFPTLRTFVQWAKLEHLPEKSQTDKNQAILDEYLSKLDAFMAMPAGERISRPTTFNADAPIVVCALGDINNQTEFGVLPLIAGVLALTTAAALEDGQISVTGDEASKLSSFDCFTSAFGGYFSGGRKQGITAHIIGQDLQSLQAGQNSSQILDNAKTWMVGRITERAANYLSDPERGLGIPAHLLKLVDQSSPEPLRAESYSRWVLRTEAKNLVVRYAPSFLHQAISFNGPKVEPLRNKFLAQHPGDRMAGYAAFARFLREQSLDGRVFQQGAR